mmetsp:Transcript_8844/g.32381  ORF Transcript_8844/g.32381 Transcript_8844/m.32381 type:complete len:348 (+) Transcript_8844:1324-2367(+)
MPLGSSACRNALKLSTGYRRASVRRIRTTSSRIFPCSSRYAAPASRPSRSKRFSWSALRASRTASGSFFPFASSFFSSRTSSSLLATSGALALALCSPSSYFNKPSAPSRVFPRYHPGLSIFAQCVRIAYFSPKSSSSLFAYALNAAVISSRVSFTEVGKYMMMPIQLCSPGPASSLPSLLTGDIGDELPALHRCSIGAGAGMPSRSIISSKSFMYARSLPSFVSTLSPVRNAISYTCCCPPQSNPRIWSLQSQRVPAFRFQNSPSAALTRFTCFKSRGSIFRSSSRSSPNPIPVTSTSGLSRLSRRAMGSTFFASGNAVVGSGVGASAGIGFDPTTTTTSVCGIHM